VFAIHRLAEPYQAHEKEKAMNPATPQRGKRAPKTDHSQQLPLDLSLPPDDAAEKEAEQEPHRVQRVNRDEMEKLKPADPDPDDPAQP
jgi:hypothetical protein